MYIGVVYTKCYPLTGYISATIKADSKVYTILEPVKNSSNLKYSSRVIARHLLKKYYLGNLPLTDVTKNTNNYTKARYTFIY
jgi:hypothetical protein